jgi:hypothetical protein
VRLHHGITQLGLFAMRLSFSFSANAQQPTKVPRIGLLDSSSASGMAVLVDAFRQELSKLGWIEGKNILIEYRFGEQKLERLPDLAAELVRYAAMTKERAEALVILHGSFTAFHRRELIELAFKHRLPTMCASPIWSTDGGLISYSRDRQDQFRRVAIYVDKILKGAKPGDLPVEQPTKFELVINLKTVKALGLTIPPQVLARADRVIK